MSLEDNPFNHLQRARHFYEKKYSRSTTEIDISNNKKIHIGYFSSDFYDHATLHLISKLFELHDKAVFKIYAYSIGSNPSDHYTYHLVSNVEVFRDIHLVDDQSAVSIVRKDNLDIAIDLNGYTKGNRFSIFANRIAPIQINYLGYPGSTGAECIDYLIADKVVIPERFEKYYSEKILYLPNSFQFNHDRREQNHPTLRRSDFGLPESSFVFVCFCANYKITPSVFNVWMRLLKQVDDSVLWLYRSNKWAEINLRRQAESRDIDPERLIFAGRLPLNKHLARHSLADLFLDTFNVNAHTTASDALLAGLPLLTLAGKSFTSRVAASLLVTLNLPELITYTIKDYEEKALMIALDPKLNRRLHEKLKLSIKESALFKPELTTKSLEDIYKELVVKHR
ncbi:Hypothetical protein P9303_20301 [Prochlorococcus marinus str. MIT 9303]|uniref:O-GlcNAc transferase C-terminal domain-containing protein n=2 Tax=Prochlorococcus marinus TaxID=1219 RepID=A2CBB2_PROM3|nr:Hypothetical protein P9303_20301 [Prochlorococcus marinus str. MIT 9303]